MVGLPWRGVGRGGVVWRRGRGEGGGQVVGVGSEDVGQEWMEGDSEE